MISFRSEESIDPTQENQLNERSSVYNQTSTTDTAFLSCKTDETQSQKPISTTPAGNRTINQSDVWYTPQSIEPRSRFLKKVVAKQIDLEKEKIEPKMEKVQQFDEKIEVIESNYNEPMSEDQPGKFWRIFNSVLPKPSLVKRAATFAGWIRRRSPEKSYKRPRNGSQSPGYEVGSSLTLAGISSHISPPLPTAKKYKTIHGRKPIERMRKVK